MTHLLAVMGLLCYEGPKNAFVHRVVQGGGFNRYTMHFQQTFPLFTEQRWRSFVDTIDWLLPLHSFLVETWNPHLFGQFKSKLGDLNVDSVTAAIRSQFFWAYVHGAGGDPCSPPIGCLGGGLPLPQQLLGYPQQGNSV